MYRQLSDKERFEALFNYATIGIVVTDDEGKIINFNKLAEKQFGYKQEEVIDKKIEILLPPSIHALHERHRHNYYKHPEPRAMGEGRDLYAQNKEGNTFPVEVSLSHYTINNQTFVIAFVIDITVRKRQEGVVLEQKKELEKITSEIRKMNSELEQKVSARTKMLREALSELEKSKEELNEAYETEKELSELKSRFVTMASHEFRTPLSTILSSTYLLEKYNEQSPDPKVEKHLQRIRGAVGGMKSILEDFLSLGKLEEGLVQTNIEKVSADVFAEDVNNLLQELKVLVKTGQTIVLNYAVKENVWAERNLLKNILTNLISNAIKFSGENSEITILSSLAGKDLVISVVDKGIGISEEGKQHLFERFFRAKNASNIQGTGLGLHIVGKYLELMNGRIEMKSKLNEGSAFTIYIPQS